jgi:hypothetical protein
MAVNPCTPGDDAVPVLLVVPVVLLLNISNKSNFERKINKSPLSIRLE